MRLPPSTLLALLLLTFTTHLSAEERPKLVKLETLVGKYTDTQDTSYLITAYQRCSALYISTSGILNSRDPDTSAIYEESAGAAMGFSSLLDIAKNMESGGDIDYTHAMGRSSMALEALVPLYVKWFNLNWLEYGSYFEDDKILSSELTTCQFLMDNPPSPPDKLK
jgi:hypothetical protein